jgi:hypothetical protein
MLERFVKTLYGIRDWWQSDKFSSKSVRVPLKLAVVVGAALALLTVGLYGAGKLRAWSGDEPAPATANQLTEFRSQMLAAVGECKVPAKVEPVKKTVAKKRK